MKHWPQWNEQHILFGLSYQNLMLYMATITDYSTDDDKGEGAAGKADAKAKPITGSKNLFDI